MEPFLEAEHLLDTCSAHIKLLLLLNALHHVLDELAGRDLRTFLFYFLEALLVLLLFGNRCSSFLLVLFICFTSFILLLGGSPNLVLSTLFFLFFLDLRLHLVHACHLVFLLHIQFFLLFDLLLDGLNVEFACLGLVDQRC